MSNKYDDPLDIMKDMPEPEPKKSKKRPRFEDALDGISRDAMRASVPESRRAGDYIRRTFTWTPGQLAMIKESAADLGFSENKTAQWLMDLGLKAWQAGARPEIVRDVRNEPKLEDW